MVSTLLAHHPSLRTQSYLESAAGEQIDAARREFLPTPSISYERADADSGDTSYRGNDQVSIVRLQQPLWTGGRLTGSLDRARAGAALTQVESDVVRLRLVTQLAELWSQAVAAEASVSAYRESEGVHVRLLAIVRRRVEGGTSAQADLQLAEARLTLVEADVTAARARRDAALERIQVMTGGLIDLAPEDVTADQIQRPPLNDLPLIQMIDLAREQSPSIARARLEVDVAAADLKIARSALSPDVFVRAETQRGSFGIQDDSTQNRLVLGVTTRLGGGLSSLPAARSAEARIEAAKSEIATQRMLVDEQVRSDLVLLQSARVRQQTLASSRQSAEEVLASSERLFLAGRRQWQEIMNSARDVAQTDAQLADALGAELNAGWRLVALVFGVDYFLRQGQIEAEGAPNN